MKKFNLSLFLFIALLSLVGCSESPENELGQPYNMINANYDDFSTGTLKRKSSIITVNNINLSAQQRGETALVACFNEQKKSGYDLVKVWLLCDPAVKPVMGETVLAAAIMKKQDGKLVWKVQATDDTPTPNEIKLIKAADDIRFAVERRQLSANDFYYFVSQTIGIPVDTSIRWMKYKDIEIK